MQYVPTLHTMTSYAVAAVALVINPYYTEFVVFEVGYEIFHNKT